MEGDPFKRMAPGKDPQAKSAMSGIRLSAKRLAHHGWQHRVKERVRRFRIEDPLKDVGSIPSVDAPKGNGICLKPLYGGSRAQDIPEATFSGFDGAKRLHDEQARGESFKALYHVADQGELPNQRALSKKTEPTFVKGYFKPILPPAHERKQAELKRYKGLVKTLGQKAGEPTACPDGQSDTHWLFRKDPPAVPAVKAKDPRLRLLVHAMDPPVAPPEPPTYQTSASDWFAWATDKGLAEGNGYPNGNANGNANGNLWGTTESGLGLVRMAPQDRDAAVSMVRDWLDQEYDLKAQKEGSLLFKGMDRWNARLLKRDLLPTREGAPHKASDNKGNRGDKGDKGYKGDNGDKGFKGYREYKAKKLWQLEAEEREKKRVAGLRAAQGKGKGSAGLMPSFPANYQESELASRKRTLLEEREQALRDSCEGWAPFVNLMIPPCDPRGIEEEPLDEEEAPKPFESGYMNIYGKRWTDKADKGNRDRNPS
jgi:hypothetical protein